MDLLSRFMSKNNKIKCLPAKLAKRREIVKYMAEKFEFGKIYAEKEINQIITNCIEFEDYVLVRRELCDFGFLRRTDDGKEYTRNE
ncbi:MAG: transcriptional regulator [Alkaliphilus sp.]|nr:MAG: transcriptional regulator [Alkaliphilus sp.]